MKRRISSLCALTVLMAVGANASSLDEDVEKLIDGGLQKLAVDRLERVEAGDPDYAKARRMLGDLYLKGDGIGADNDRAVALYREAAQLGDAEAAYGLGHCYETGAGVPQSAEAAFTWYDRAAEESPRAALRYAELALANEDSEKLRVRHDPIERIRFAANHGLPRAQYLLATMIKRGETRAVTGESIEQLLKKASESVPKAKTALAELAHNDGEIDEAKALFEAALEGGDNAAAAYIGYYSEFGIGEPIDREKAYEHYVLAQGVPWADQGRERIEERERSVEMFGLKMYGTTRKEVKDQFLRMGIQRVAGEPHFDVFDVRREMGGKKVFLTVAYAPGEPEFVAELNYRFVMDDLRSGRALTDELTESLMKEYGLPNISDRSRGVTIRQWTKGSAAIILRSTPREDSLYITYHLQPFAETLARYVEQRRKALSGEADDAL